MTTQESEVDVSGRESRIIVMHHGLDALPNAEGFRFRGIRRDGELVPCVVMKSALGEHFAASEETGRGVYYELRGWMPYLDEPVSGPYKLGEGEKA